MEEALNISKNGFAKIVETSSQCMFSRSNVKISTVVSDWCWVERFCYVLLYMTFQAKMSLDVALMSLNDFWYLPCNEPAQYAVNLHWAYMEWHLNWTLPLYWARSETYITLSTHIVRLIFYWVLSEGSLTWVRI